MTAAGGVEEKGAGSGEETVEKVEVVEKTCDSMRRFNCSAVSVPSTAIDGIAWGGCCGSVAGGVSSMADVAGEEEVVEEVGEADEVEVVERVASRRLRLVDSLSVEVDLSLALSLLGCGRYRVRMWQWSGCMACVSQRGRHHRCSVCVWPSCRS